MVPEVGRERVTHQNSEFILIGQIREAVKALHKLSSDFYVTSMPVVTLRTGFDIPNQPVRPLPSLTEAEKVQRFAQQFAREGLA